MSEGQSLLDRPMCLLAGTPLNRVTINKETLEMTHDVFTEDE
ncbi:hypothetical protein [Photobacterium sanguinicancri]|nr:hypothetical protein [Photobacterium sanguinicancri]MDO6498039.1 hypothetical protein [Photobacterium sanguinicancri]